MTSNGEAIAGSDYTSSVGTLTFADGEVSKTITLSTSDDVVSEGDEKFIVTLNSPTGGATLITPDSTAITIVDNEPLPNPQIQLSPNNTYRMDENVYLLLTVVRSGFTTGTAKVKVETVNGTAIAGKDYREYSEVLTFLPSEVTKHIRIYPHSDAEVEGDETLTIKLSDVSGATLGTSNSATITINDSYSSSDGTARLSTTNYTANEGDGGIVIGIVRVDGVTGTASFKYETMDGSATAGEDYTAISGTVSFGNSDDGPKLFTIPITADTVVEGNETFRVILKTMDGRTLGSTLVTIADGVKAAGPGNLEFLQDSYSIREDKGSIDVTMVRNGGVIGTVGVSYSTNNGSALAGSDYTSTSGTVTFAEGETSKVVTIPIVDNTVYEDDETFTITLSSPTGGANLGARSTATVIITDNEPVPPGQLQFEASNYSVVEGVGSVKVKVTRTNGNNGIVGVSYVTNDVTAGSGLDYTRTTGTLTFADKEVSKEITIPILNDTSTETVESFTVTLSSPTGGASLGIPSYTVVQINDDDSPAPVITNITPAFWRVDSTVSVLLTGNNFGTNPTVSISGTGITITRNSASDTQIDTTFTIALDTAPAGERKVTVIADGKISNEIIFTVYGAAVPVLKDWVIEDEDTEDLKEIKVNPTSETVPINAGSTGGYLFHYKCNYTICDSCMNIKPNVSGLPPGISEAFTPADNIKIGDIVYLKMRASLDAAPGVYPITIGGTDNCLNLKGDTTSFTLRIKPPEPPELSGPNSVVRGSTATFKIWNTSEATISGWKFEGTVTSDSAGGTENITIKRTTGTGNTTWSRMMVTSGTIKVRVVRGGKTYDLSKTVTVTPRTNFAWLPVPPTEVTNGFIAEDGELMKVSSPPNTGGNIGYAHLQLKYSHFTEDIADNGPNHKIKYVKSITDSVTDSATGKVIPRRFYYVISPDLKDINSEFYKKQCGDYNKVTNPTGFISGAQLLTNTIHHESGPLKNSHYSQYVAAQNNPANNMGVIGEKITGSPSITFSTFSGIVKTLLETADNRIRNVMGVEPCGGISNVGYDADCIFHGYVNFSPYVSCPAKFSKEKK